MIFIHKNTVAVVGILLIMGATLAARQSGTPDRRVVQAAKRGDIATVRALVRQRADVNAADSDGSTALLYAAYRSDVEMTRALLAAKAAVNVANRYGVSPLLQAGRVGSAPIVEALVQAGANIEGVHPEGETPLMAASQSGSLEAVRLLLARKANVNGREESQGQTALMFAADEGHFDVVKALLEAGADRDAIARFTSLVARRHADHPSGGLTALMLAARQGNLEVARALADAGAAVNLTNPDGATALVIAVYNDRLDLAAMLLEKGANPNDGSLFQAVDVRNMVRDNFVNDPTRPRPDHANQISSLDLIARLLDRGADPAKVFAIAMRNIGNCCANAPNASGYARALQAGDVESVKLMLAKGANANVVEGNAPLMAAMAGGGGRGGGGGPGGNAGPTVYREAFARSPIETVRALIDSGADVNAARPNGDTPMHTAAQAGNLPMIQLLADRGAMLDVQNKAGLTPLDLASGKQAPPDPAAAAAARGGGGGGRGAAAGPRPNPAAMALLRKLMGLPEDAAPAAAPGPAAPGPAAAGGNQ